MIPIVSSFAATAAPTFRIPNRQVRDVLVQALDAWQFNPAGANNEAKVSAAFKLWLKVIKHLPPESRAAPPVLYRGVVLGRDLREQLRQNLVDEKPVVLTFKPRPLSSYTPSLSFAKHFTRNFVFSGRHADPALILRRTIPSSQVMVNLPATTRALVASMEKDELEYFKSIRNGNVYKWSFVNEIIVRNTSDLLKVGLDEVYLFEGQKGKSIGKNVRKVNQNQQEVEEAVADFKKRIRKIFAAAGLNADVKVSAKALLALEPAEFIYIWVTLSEGRFLRISSFASAASKPELGISLYTGTTDGKNRSSTERKLIEDEPFVPSRSFFDSLVSQTESLIRKYSR